MLGTAKDYYPKTNSESSFKGIIIGFLVHNFGTLGSLSYKMNQGRLLHFIFACKPFIEFFPLTGEKSEKLNVQCKGFWPKCFSVFHQKWVTLCPSTVVLGLELHFRDDLFISLKGLAMLTVAFSHFFKIPLVPKVTKFIFYNISSPLLMLSTQKLFW